MSGKRKLILLFILLIGLISLLSLYVIFFVNTRPGPRTNVGSEMSVAAQDFELPTLSGDYARLSNFRGKVVFLNIWATWCPPCREEMPSMESLYRKLKGRDFEMLAVSIDGEGGKAVRPFAAKYRLTFPVLLDPDNKTPKLYGLTGVPETFIIDKNGMVIKKVIGAQNWVNREWLDYFDRIIG